MKNLQQFFPLFHRPGTIIPIVLIAADADVRDLFAPIEIHAHNMIVSGNKYIYTHIRIYMHTHTTTPTHTHTHTLTHTHIYILILPLGI